MNFHLQGRRDTPNTLEYIVYMTTGFKKVIVFLISVHLQTVPHRSETDNEESSYTFISQGLFVCIQVSNIFQK